MPKLTIARHASGRMIDIRAADNGLACDCVCSCCGERLVARQGELRAKSFAHEGRADCAGAIETALHNAAKQILEEEKTLYIGTHDPVKAIDPNFYQKIRNAIYTYPQLRDSHSTEVDALYRLADPPLVDNFLKYKALCAIDRIKLVNVVTEQTAADSERRPDVTATTMNGNKLYVEFVVTNECDQEKIAELGRLGVPTIQIGLQALREYEFSLDDIKRVIVEGRSPENLKKDITRVWLVKPKYMQYAEQLAQELIHAATVTMAGWKEELKQEAARKQQTLEVIARQISEVREHLLGGVKIKSGSKPRENIYFFEAEIFIDQQETEAKVQCNGYGLYGEDLLEVMAGLGAKLINKTSWRIVGNNVEDMLNEAIDKKRMEIRRMNLGGVPHHYKRRPQSQNSDKVYRIKETPKTPKTPTVDAPKRVVDIAAATKAIIEKHSGIVDYRWRRMKINEELVSLGYPQI